MLLFNIFVETVMHVSGFFLIESSKEQHLFETETFCNIIHVFIVMFDCYMDPPF